MNEIEDVFKGNGIEVGLNEDKDFLKIMETLTRIGTASKDDNTLNQSCHILHKKGRYAILHYKELFQLDGKEVDILEEDLARRNTTVRLLEQWNLLKIVGGANEDDVIAPINQIKIISHKDKAAWNLVASYNIGTKRKTIG